MNCRFILRCCQLFVGGKLWEYLLALYDESMARDNGGETSLHKKQLKSELELVINCSEEINAGNLM